MFLKTVGVLAIFNFAFAFDKFIQKADICTTEKCKIEDNCRCSSPNSPINKESIPQLVALTFVESVTNDLFKDYWSELLLDRVNPDNIPIGATFFVPHEYTDYQRVNDLYNYGFEIGVHSISKNSNQEYWRKATVDTLIQEFGGQRTIISKFANIPADSIVGVRTPQLQLAGNNSIKAFVNTSFLYDSSWPTRSNASLFPYTLDYLSTQECVIGAECPNEEFKGFWESPIVDLTGQDGAQCSTLAACNLTGTLVDDIENWLYGEIIKVRNNTKTPLTLVVESQWFEKYENAFKALGNVMDRLLELGDVYFVAQEQLMHWMKKPVPISEFRTEYDETRSAACYLARTCELKKSSYETRYMSTCVECPISYPWLGNPLGE